MSIGNFVTKCLGKVGTHKLAAPISPREQLEALTKSTIASFILPKPPLYWQHFFDNFVSTSQKIFGKETKNLRNARKRISQKRFFSKKLAAKRNLAVRESARASKGNEISLRPGSLKRTKLLCKVL